MSDGIRHTNDLIASRWLDEYPIAGPGKEMTPALSCIYIKDQNLLYYYKDGVYEMIPDDSLETMVYRFSVELKRPQEGRTSMKPSQNITMSTVGDIMRQIKLQVTQRVDTLRSNFITFNDNRVLDLTTFELHNWSRKYHSIFKIDAPSTVYTDPRNPDQWLAFLKQVLVQENGQVDTSLIDYMQEVFGYCLLDTNEAHESYFMYGSGANGKSVLLGILKAMFPPSVVSSSTLQSLTNNKFSLASLRSKRINITNEEESKFIKSDLFKNIISGEEVTAEHKFEKEFQFYPRVRLIFATNKMPKLDGVEKAIRRRLKIIPFYAEIPGDKQDSRLMRRLIDEELPQIIVWAIEGAKRIQEQQFKFNEPKCLEDTMRDFEEGQSSIVEFINENFEITGDEEDVYQKSQLYERYVEWCKDVGRAQPARRTFFSELEVRYKSEGLRQPKDPIWQPDIRRTLRAVTGIKVTSDRHAWIASYMQPKTNQDL